MFAASLILAIAGVAAILFLWFHRPVASTKTKTTSTTAAARASAVKQGRGVKLVQVSPSAKGSEDTHGSPETDTGIDIIAIHGLDTASPRTWEFKKEDGGRVNWLADKHMLPAEVPGTRIFTCDWPAEGLETKDSVSLRIHELALSLLQGIIGSDVERKRPILFVASCLGGIILMQALVEANDEYACIREATRGVIFLATPFRGTAFRDSAIWAQPALRIKALVLGKKVSKLLGWLNEPTFDLTRLVGQFTRLCKGRDHEGFDVFTFYETGTTYLPAQVPLLSFLLPGSRRPLVDMSSATLDCVPNPLPLHRNHSKMNKFCGPRDSDPDYKSVVEVIKRFLLTIRTGTPLGKADAWIWEEYYDKQRLRIERLSGDSLEMSQCYINLALVEIQKVRNSETKPEGPSPFSLTERLKLEAPHKNLQVELPNLFQPRKTPDGMTKTPRRILIRGRAGVGKTTLCKKIVYDFIHGGMWQDLFKRVVWIRLRELKSLPDDKYSLDKVFKNIFFQQHSQHTFLSNKMCNKICTELWRHIEETQSRDTLFLLDGLDEVPELTMEYRHGNPHPGQEVLRGLLNRPNVIITTRPHATLTSDFQQPHLELDTMGFSRDQVQTYIEAVMPEEKDTIRAYLEKHRIMQSLVQIPIQLDALCFTWQASAVWNTVIPETMTAVYEAMIGELWRKDNERLEKDGFQIIGNASPAETNPFDSIQYENLGYLAFSGLCSNVIEFQPHHRNALYRFMKKQRTSLSFDETFARLSFWRTSDRSNSSPNQSYHFIHLTFQEYFSAKHFAKAWRDGKNIEYVDIHGKRAERKVVSCRKFLGKHKFTARYNIMWRFVAGILDEDEAHASRLFQAIEGEPVDMLGPTQQRLVMHCLAEVTQSADLRIRLEDELSQWLEFELDFRKRSQFVREAEFPVRAIHLVLERTSEENKITVLNSFGFGCILPFTMVEFISGWLDSGALSQPLQIAALRALAGKSLPIRTISSVISLMDNDDAETSDWSVKILEFQAPWPDDILRAVMTRLEIQDSDKDSGVKRRTAIALGRDSMLSGDLIRGMALWMNDGNFRTTKAVLETLGYQHKLDKDIIWSIATKLEDQQQIIRTALETLSTLGRREVFPSDTLSAITKQIFHDDEYTRRAAAETLVKIWNRQGSPPELLNYIVAELKNHDAGIRKAALEGLAVFGLEHSFFDWTFDAIAVHLADLDREVKCASVLTLRTLADHRTFPSRLLWPIAALLGDTDSKIRFQALKALGSLGRRQSFPSDVVEVIADQLGGDLWMKSGRFPFEALADQPSLPEDTIQAMVVLGLKRRGLGIRRAVLGLIRQLPKISEEVRKLLVALLEDTSTGVRQRAVEALIVHGGLSDDIYPTIARLLQCADSGIRHSVVELLRACPTLSDGMLQAVTRRVDDNNGRVKNAALKTLKAQHKLPDIVLKSAALYSFWLEKSLNEDIHCTMEDGVTYLEWPAGFGRRSLWGEPNEFRKAIRKRQVELGMPVRSTERTRRL
ncbi:uncharacterized protein B0J16DRAFT_309637 [Fusarium flagelliforme]|uniref:uncharacterized protein n=1 Tax=Fusarium flagelliforme TaxID=2675880 RepID=UPI001E8DE06E|nr:uncharacterized protein B0J16DRAFT_309637 [Fusarium flagelliforme]KAH7174213.1 hypothetical protein B0J16DRAFT_309637 [Fusarium flagelliforme]